MRRYGPPRWFRNLPPAKASARDIGCFSVFGCTGLIVIFLVTTSGSVAFALFSLFGKLAIGLLVIVVACYFILRK